MDEWNGMEWNGMEELKWNGTIHVLTKRRIRAHYFPIQLTERQTNVGCARRISRTTWVAAEWRPVRWIRRYRAPSGAHYLPPVVAWRYCAGDCLASAAITQLQNK